MLSRGKHANHPTSGRIVNQLTVAIKWKKNKKEEEEEESLYKRWG